MPVNFEQNEILSKRYPNVTNIPNLASKENQKKVYKITKMHWYRVRKNYNKLSMPILNIKLISNCWRKKYKHWRPVIKNWMISWS